MRTRAIPLLVYANNRDWCNTWESDTRTSQHRIWSLVHPQALLFPTETIIMLVYLDRFLLKPHITVQHRGQMYSCLCEAGKTIIKTRLLIHLCTYIISLEQRGYPRHLIRTIKSISQNGYYCKSQRKKMDDIKTKRRSRMLSLAYFVNIYRQCH